MEPTRRPPPAPRQLRWRHAAVAVAICALVAAGYFLRLHDVPPFAAIEQQTLGWRFQIRGPVPVPDMMAILAIDDRTIAHANSWPLPRRMLADAVARTRAGGAKAIGLDLLFLELEPPSDGLTPGPGDRALRAALADADVPVLGAALTFGPADSISPAVQKAVTRSGFRIVSLGRGYSSAATLRATGALVPLAPFWQVARIGHVNVPVDEGATLHRLALAIAIDDSYLPAFPLALAARYLDLVPEQMVLRLGEGVDLGTRFVATDPMLRMVLNHYGPTGSVPTYSMLDLLEDRLPADALAGRAVVIGATGLGAGDTLSTPFSAGLPGVEALAAAAANLIAGQQLDRTAQTAGLDIAAILLLGLAAFLLAQLPAPVAAVAASLGLLIGWGVVAQYAFASHHLWLNVTFPSLAVLLNGAWVAVRRLVIERRLRGVAEQQRSNLSRYHSPLIADFLAEGESAALDGGEQLAAILFIDIAGFTARSERLGPAGTAEFLGDFHDRVEQVVLRHGGVLEQFAGDGAMVIFGVPRPGSRDPAAALGCGRDLVAAVEIWNRELAGAGAPPVDIGVGIHYGPVVIARLGGRSQLQLTAAGDTVNLASRLESLTRSHQACIVVSDALVEAVRALGDGELMLGFEAVAPQAVRGRNEPVGVWILRRLPT